MMNARENVGRTMNNVDPDKKHKVWSFLNIVRMGIAPRAELDHVQENLLTSIVQEVACDLHTTTLNDSQRSEQWAMQIATWVNGVHVATRLV